MNPFLEESSLWRTVHAALIYGIFSELNRIPPAGFAARIDERLYLVEPERNVYPDVAVLQPVRGGRTGVGTTATLEPLTSAALSHDVPYLLTEYREEMHESFITIFSIRYPQRVITAIEVLSPTNKLPGNGRESYQQKQYEFLNSSAHLLELDFLRGGLHTVAISPATLAAREERCTWDYVFCLSCAERRTPYRNDYEVWTRTLREPLPRVRVPLTSENPDVVLDLQQMLNRAYTDGIFRSLRYEPGLSNR